MLVGAQYSNLKNYILSRETVSWIEGSNIENDKTEPQSKNEAERSIFYETKLMI